MRAFRDRAGCRSRTTRDLTPMDVRIELKLRQAAGKSFSEGEPEANRHQSSSPAWGILAGLRSGLMAG